MPHRLDAHSRFLVKLSISLKGIFLQYSIFLSNCWMMRIVQNYQNNLVHRFRAFLFIFLQKSEQGEFSSFFWQNISLLHLVVEVTVFEVCKTRVSLALILDFVSLRTPLPFWARALGLEFEVAMEASW